MAGGMKKIFLLLAVGLCCGWMRAEAQGNLVKNPGFEEPAAANGLPGGGWWLYEGVGHTVAKVERDVAHSGKASVQLQSGEEAKCVLVSPHFEVAPGDELRFGAWVKAIGVTTNHQATYAGLAFRRRDGRVIERAYFQSAPLSGEWKLISGTARAPADAVSAEVHLGYTNSPATVWFDEVEAVITNAISFSLIEAAKTWPGEQEITVRVVNRGTNEFKGSVAWAMGKDIRKLPVTVASHQTRDLQVLIALNGVGAHEYKLSLLDPAGVPLRVLSGKFRTTAPLVLFPGCPCYHVAGQGNGDTRIDARVNLNPAQRAGLKMRVEVADATGQTIQTEETDAAQGEFVGLNLRVPVGKPAAFEITARLIDRTGKQIATDKTEVRVASAKAASVTIGPDGFLQVGEAPHFPIGMYNCGHYEEMGRAGFSATHEYGITTGEAEDAINPNESHLKELLDKSWANGMRMMVELPRKAIEKAQWTQVRRRIETFRHHPGLLCWGSEERVARGDAPLANITALYALVRELDPEHPLVLGDACDVIQKLQKDRRNFFPDGSMDVGIWWWYPIPLKEPDGNGLEGGGRSPDLLEPPAWLTTTFSKKPLWIAIQSYQKPSKDARFPTPEEYRCMAYLSIINGVKGIFFYTGSGQRDYLGKPSGLLNKPVAAHWQYVQKLVSELREFSPVIMAPRAVGETSISPVDAPVEFALRQVGEKVYLIAANKSGRTQKAQFRSALLKDRKVRVLYEEHPVTVEENSLTDEFAPFGVHLYELSQAK